MPTTFDRVKTVAVLVLIGVLILPVPMALANSAPTLELWLEFGYETSDPPELEGVQLLGCGMLECSQPTLLLQYGTCDSEGCLSSSPSLNTVQPLECLGDRCVGVFYAYSDETLPPFKVVCQFPDRVRESNLLSGDLPAYGTLVWEIAVNDSTLSVAASDDPLQDAHAPYSGSFLQHFGLTLVTELLVATAALRGWLKLRERSLLTGLGYVVLANIISYPVTWIFWPSLGRFQPMEMRLVGYFVVCVAIVFTAVLVGLSRKEGDARRIWLILTVVLLPLAVLATLSCLLVVSLGVAYGGFGGGRIAVRGLPFGLTIAFAEAFAVSFEALLLYLLARKTLALSFKQAAIISLLMNLSSFLAGWALSSWL